MEALESHCSLGWPRGVAPALPPGPDVEGEDRLFASTLGIGVEDNHQARCQYDQ